MGGRGVPTVNQDMEDMQSDGRRFGKGRSALLCSLLAWDRHGAVPCCAWDMIGGRETKDEIRRRARRGDGSKIGINGRNRIAPRHRQGREPRSGAYRVWYTL